MKAYQLYDIIPERVMKSHIPRVKMGYAKFLSECVTSRIFLEAMGNPSETLNRIATQTVNAFNDKNKSDPGFFNALMVFWGKIDNIVNQLKGQYKDETDPEAKKNLANLVTSYRFLTNPEKDLIIKKALMGAKSSSGNRLAEFIRLVVENILKDNKGNPIEEFKKEATNLRDAIEKFYYEGYPFQATIKPYKEMLLGPNSVVGVMDKIADNLVNIEPDIIKMDSGISHKSHEPKGFSKNVTPGNNPVFFDNRINHKYESQTAFMEAFAQSLKYFSGKK